MPIARRFLHARESISQQSNNLPGSPPKIPNGWVAPCARACHRYQVGNVLIEVSAVQRQLTVPFDEHESAVVPVSGTLQAIAKSALKFRARRRRILGSANFSDPAWDLLLVLASQDDDAGVAIAEVAKLAGVSVKVIERFVALLAAQGLVELVPAADATTVRLTGSGQAALARLIS